MKNTFLRIFSQIEAYENLHSILKFVDSLKFRYRFLFTDDDISKIKDIIRHISNSGYKEGVKKGVAESEYAFKHHLTDAWLEGYNEGREDTFRVLVPDKDRDDVNAEAVLQCCGNCNWMNLGNECANPKVVCGYCPHDRWCPEWVIRKSPPRKPTPEWVKGQIEGEER